MKSVATLAWLRMARVVQKIERCVAEDLRGCDLSLAQFDVLAHITAAEGLTQAALADALLVTQGNICQLLDRLERDGLIERRQVGRANHLYLTPTGRARIGGALPHHERNVADLFSALAPEEQAHLLALLRTLDHALPAGTGHDAPPDD